MKFLERAFEVSYLTGIGGFEGLERKKVEVDQEEVLKGQLKALEVKSTQDIESLKGQLSGMSNLLAERDKQISELHASMAEKERLLKEMSEKGTELEGKQKELLSSNSQKTEQLKENSDLRSRLSSQLREVSVKLEEVQKQLGT